MIGLSTTVNRSSRRSAFPSDPLLRSAYSLILNVVLTSGLGVLFWVVAARMFPAAEVGRDSALLSAMLLLSAVCQLNLSSGLLRFLPIIKLNPVKAVLSSYGLAGIASALGATAFVLIAPRVSASYQFLSHDPPLAIMYVAGTTSWGVFTLQDSVLTAMRRTHWVPLENGLFGVLKIVALPLLLAAGSLHAVFVAWVIPMAMLVVPVNYAIFKRFMPARAAAEGQLSPLERFGWWGLMRFLAADSVATIFIQAGSSLVPVLVVAILGSSLGAYFYVPFTIVTAFDSLFLSVTVSMTVEASRANDRLTELARTTVRRFGGLLGAGVVVLIAGAGLILLPYGPGYAHAGAPVLRLLAAASVFRAVSNLYSAICRVKGRAGRVLALQAALFVMTTGLTLVLASHRGLTGVGIAWLCANGIVSCAVAPSFFRALRHGPRAGGAQATLTNAPTRSPRYMFLTVTRPSPESRANLDKLVGSIERQGIVGDLVLVMFGGVDDAPALGRRFAHRHTTAVGGLSIYPVKAPSTIGLNGARNLGLSRAERLGLLDAAGIVAFPDDDASYPDDLLHRIDGLIDDENAIVCCPYAPASDQIDENRFSAGRRELTAALAVRVVNSTNIFAHVSVVRQVGRFDERLGLGASFAAVDYVLRARAAGFRGVYTPSGSWLSIRKGAPTARLRHCSRVLRSDSS